jgi:hypothetical protein
MVLIVTIIAISSLSMRKAIYSITLAPHRVILERLKLRLSVILSIWRLIIRHTITIGRSLLPPKTAIYMRFVTLDEGNELPGRPLRSPLEGCGIRLKLTPMGLAPARILCQILCSLTSYKCLDSPNDMMGTDPGFFHQFGRGARAGHRRYSQFYHLRQLPIALRKRC